MINLKQWVRRLGRKPASSPAAAEAAASDVTIRAAQAEIAPIAAPGAAGPALASFEASWETPAAPPPQLAETAPAASDSDDVRPGEPDSLTSDAGTGDIRLATLIGMGGASVRLRNIAALTDLFEQHTVADFTLGRLSAATILALPNCGQTTLRELRGLVRSHEARASRPGDAGPTPPGIDITLAILNSSAGSSVRLRNIARNTDLFEQHTVADFLAGRLSPAAILALPNCGRTSLREISRLARAHHGRGPETGDNVLALAAAEEERRARTGRLEGLTLMSLADHQGLPIRFSNRLVSDSELQSFPLTDILNDPVSARRRLRSIGAIGVRSVDELFALVNSLADAPAPEPEPGDCDEAPVVLISSGESVSQALAALSEKHRYVLTARYGLDGAPPLTLDEVGRKVFVTRERVRQVQKKAIGVLSRRPSLNAFEDFLYEAREDAWVRLAGGRDFLSADALSGRVSPLEPLVTLAVDVVHGDLRRWLSTFAVPSDGGWLPPGASAAARRDGVARVREALAGHALPCPLDDLAAAADMSPDTCSALLGTLPAIKVHDGYVHRGFFGSKARRAARLHRLAVAEGTAVVDVWRLHALDTAADHTDERSGRMVMVQLAENPHLFAPLYDHYWIVLAPSLDWEATRAVLAEADMERLDPGFEDTSLSRWLWQRLSEAGPMRLSDIRDEAVAAMPTVAGSSIGALLQTHPAFYRLAPGVFDVRTVRPDGVPAALLTNFQARAWARARRGGAGLRYFPGWAGDFEWRLLEWARWHADPDVFRSLLAVSSPFEWPAPASFRDEWAILKTQQGRWLLDVSRRATLGDRPPTGPEFFAGLAHLVAYGSIGSIGADRITQSRLGSQGAADLLALLIVAGAAAAPEDWQLPHEATSAAPVLLEALCSDLRRTGQLIWNEEPLASVLRTAEDQQGRVSWAQAGEVAVLVQQLVAGQSQSAPASAQLADAEALFGSEEWDSLFRDQD